MRESNSSTYDSECTPLLSKNDKKRSDVPSQVSSPPEVLERSIQKFWVLPSNCLEVKREISCNMPKWSENKELSAGLAESGSWVSSIYFDTVKWSLYRKRLSGADNSILLRWRWYSKHLPTRSGFMEEEIKKGDMIIKRRFPTSSVDCVTFLKDGCTASIQLEGMREDMFRDLRRLGLEFHPKIRTTHRRTVFQDSEHDIRVTFDEDVHLISITNFEGGLEVDVEQAMNNAFLFPLAILEVKLEPCNPEQNSYGYMLPTWCDDLVDRGMLTKVHNFSKYLTSVACFHLDEVELTPAWLEATRTMVSIEMLKQNTEILGCIQNTEAMPQTIEIVETKSFLANERTFLKWTRMCFLAFFAGFSLAGLGIDPVLGLVLAICSLLTLFRAYYVYWERLKMIQSSKYKVRLDDKCGPHFLLLILVVPSIVFIIKYGIKLVAILRQYE